MTIDHVTAEHTELYNQRMAGAMDDKLFWMEHIQPSSVFDYGCADGALLKAARDRGSWFVPYGYDSNPVQTLKAASVGLNASTDFDNLYAQFKANHRNGRSALILSSVLHEVYSWGTPEEVDQFWTRIHRADFDYIVIRDMGIDPVERNRPTPPGWIRAAYSRIPNRLIYDFEATHGPITYLKQFIHLLLKYPYEDNWQHELLEDYFAVDVQYLLSKFSRMSDLTRKWYTPIFLHHWSLPFVRERIWNDLEIHINTPTHFKMIFKVNRQEK